ncbi:DUF1570 domain-containing protein [Phycisphaerales bacterium AB-hyl4]|uniref:DUF1570 domain-containing protein n=1 Tax=Natronomicrosphaera hydrolytica TaxID=3242702 RepID=A0ABV4U8Z8_9BACT
MLASRRLSLVLLASWIALVSGTPAPAQVRMADLWKHESVYYDIRTNLPAEEVQWYADRMDHVYEEFQWLTADFGGRERQHRPESLFLVETAPDYRTLMRSFGIRAEHAGGMYFSTDSHRRSGLITYVGGRDRHHVLRVLRHEAFHQFAARHFGGRLPRWLNEGFAGYFERSIVVDDRIAVGFAAGSDITALRQIVAERRHIPLDELFDISPSAWRRAMRHDRERSRVQYLQSWSMVHFFMHAEEGRYAPAFQQFLNDLAGGRGGRVAFREAFGADIAVAEQRWIAYVLEEMAPDRRYLAKQRLLSVGSQLRFAAERGDLPTTLDEMNVMFDQAEATPPEPGPHGITMPTVPGDGRSLMSYLDDEDQWVSFELQEATDDALPPTVVGSGLTPSPVLVWTRGFDGQLHYEVTFRTAVDED